MKYEELVKRLRAMGYSFCDYAADAIDALAAENARLAASEPMCVAVKPLEWEHVTLTQTWQAKSIFGEYAVGFDDGWWAHLGGYANWEWNAHDDPRSYHGPDAAKAAAQADYDARILSAITLRPEAEVSAEAWAAAIEAAAVKMAKGGLHTVFDRSEAIRALQQPADISAALDRIKAEAKAEGMQQVTDVRTWFHYPIVMPLKNGKGPVSDAECDTITWEVWDQLLNTHASFDNLPDAINEAMRLNNAMQDNEQ